MTTPPSSNEPRAAALPAVMLFIYTHNKVNSVNFSKLFSSYIMYIILALNSCALYSLSFFSLEVNKTKNPEACYVMNNPQTLSW